MIDRLKRSKVLAQLGLPCLFLRTTGCGVHLLLLVTTEPTRKDDKMLYQSIIANVTVAVYNYFLFPQLILNKYNKAF
jgi:hypothetical protein